MTPVSVVTADSLLRDAHAAIDTLLTTLSALDEQARGLAQEAQAAHSTMKRHLHDIGLYDTPLIGQSLGDAGVGGIDHDAILRDELAHQQTVTSMRTTHDKLNALMNLVRIGRSQLLGTRSAEADDLPWHAVVRTSRIEAQELERVRLAREIHDGPSQVLANAIVSLEYCEIVAKRDPNSLSGELQRLRSTMREGLVEVRRFMFDLRPTILANLGLNATLGRYVADFQQSCQIPVDLQLPRQEIALDDTVQIALFRVVQESLQNVKKHARASQIHVELTLPESGLLHLRITDNGCGFEPRLVTPTSRSGAGLLGMSERAAAIGATLSIDSAPMRGTIICLSLPIGVSVAGATQESHAMHTTGRGADLPLLASSHSE